MNSLSNSISVSRLLIVALLLQGYSSAPVFAAVATSPGVFFLGVDTGPALNTATGQARAGIGDDDRWAFSEFAREAMQQTKVSNLTHSLADWRPLDDPFNVGVIILTSLNTTSESFREKGYRYFASAELVWVHVGQDRLSVGMSSAFPEVRSAITHQRTAVGQGSEPFNDDDIQQLELSAVKEGIRELAQHVADYQTRSVVRNALDIRYVSIEAAPPGARARENFAAVFGAGGEQDSGSLQKRVAQITESLLMKAVNKAPSLEHLVILPGRETLDLLVDLWPQYARRVFARSENSGARRVMGEAPPRMRVIGADCAQDSDVRVIPVSGWHVRTTLAAIEVSSTELSKHALAHRVRLATAAALRASEAGQNETFRPDPVVGMAITEPPLMRPRETPVATVLNEYELGILAREALDATVQKLVKQLEQLKEQPVSKLLKRDACHEKT